jgi:solute carrier family 25 (mitochondrial carnitine/acylcarnitine transporter), member 20/29
MQMQTNTRDPRKSYTSSFDTLKKIYKINGFQSLYRGLGITIARDVISFASFFGTYEILKQKLTKKGEAKNLPLLMSFGALSSITSWIC